MMELMESQSVVSDPEGFSRIGEINYLDTENLLLKRCLFKYKQHKQ